MIRGYALPLTMMMSAKALFIGKVAQKTTMRDGDNLDLRARPEPPQKCLTSGFGGLVLVRPFALVARPVIGHEVEVDGAVLEGLPDDKRAAAGTASRGADLLELGESEALDPAGYFWFEGAQGGLDGAAEGGGDEQVDGGVVREASFEVEALFLARRCQRGVTGVGMGAGIHVVGSLHVISGIMG